MYWARACSRLGGSLSALALRKQWEQEGTKCERAAESGVRMICMCARARGIGNMKYRGNPRVFPEFPDFYLSHTHKQCDCDVRRGI